MYLVFYLSSFSALNVTLTPVGEVVVVNQENATFICTATGGSLPPITWWRMGEQLSDGSKYTISEYVNGAEAMSNLTVVMATLDDNGTYTCRVGSEERSVDLTVLGT